MYPVVLVLLLGIVLVVIGFTILLLEALRNRENGKVEGGMVVVIGPLPIVIGSSERVSIILLVLAIVLTAIVLSIFLLQVQVLGG